MKFGVVHSEYTDLREEFILKTLKGFSGKLRFILIEHSSDYTGTRNALSSEVC